jgi:hypothetical protein
MIKTIGMKKKIKFELIMVLASVGTILLIILASKL